MGVDGRPVRSSKVRAMERVQLQQQVEEEDPEQASQQKFSRSTRGRRARTARAVTIDSSEEEAEGMMDAVNDVPDENLHDSNDASAFAEHDPEPHQPPEENGHDNSEDEYEQQPLSKVYLNIENPQLEQGAVVTKSGRLSKPPPPAPTYSPQSRPRRSSNPVPLLIHLNRDQRAERRRRRTEGFDDYDYSQEPEERRSRLRNRKSVSYKMDDADEHDIADDEETHDAADMADSPDNQRNFTRLTRSRVVKLEDKEAQQNRRASLRSQSVGNPSRSADSQLGPPNGVPSPRRTRSRQRGYAPTYHNSDEEVEGDGDFSPGSGEESDDMDERGFDEQEVLLDSGPPVDESGSELAVPSSRRQTRQRSSRKAQPQRGIRAKRKRRPTRSTRQENSLAREARNSFRPRKVSIRPTDFYPDAQSSSSEGSMSSGGQGPPAKRSRPTRAAASRAGDAIAKKLAPVDYLENPMGTANVGRPVRPSHPGRYNRRRDRLRATGGDPFASDGDDVLVGQTPGIEPIQVDLSTTWNDVGGLEHHVRALKEMVALPLMYPEVFQKFNMQPPKGVLFYGPPGTGKTLCARALAASCGAEPEPEETPASGAQKEQSKESAQQGKDTNEGAQQISSQANPTSGAGQGSDVVMAEAGAGDEHVAKNEGGASESPVDKQAEQASAAGEVGAHSIAKQHESVVANRGTKVQSLLERREGGINLQPPEGSNTSTAAGKQGKPATKRKPRVSFFMRNGADCLSKWVGEAERQLRMTFEAAKKHQPAIIFFDEIDGLAPVRSSRQDQIHSSIVSTLLGLMDGLDSRGNIVVIGATNRVDAIDPALRRPGRFDRELIFTLPNAGARRKILDIHTSKWSPSPSSDVLDSVANMTVGYCGADLKALCSESALRALRRRYPQIYDSTDKLLINVDEVKVATRDFLAAMREIVPASHRSARTYARPLSKRLQAVLGQSLDSCMTILKDIFPEGLASACNNGTDSREKQSDNVPSWKRNQSAVDLLSSSDEDEEHFNSAQVQSKIANAGKLRPSFGRAKVAKHQTIRPRLLVCGIQGLGQAELGPAILHNCEGCPVHAIDFPSLHADAGARTAEEALISAFREALRSVPSILYLPHLQLWWESAPQSLRTTLIIALKDLPADLPLLVLATAENHVNSLPPELIDQFGEMVELNVPSEESRQKMFEPLLQEAQAVPRLSNAAAKRRRRKRQMEVLPKAPPVLPKPQTQEELNQKMLNEDRCIRRLRMEMRGFVETLLRDSRFKAFWNPVDPTSAPDYYDIIKVPMDISKIAAQVDLGKYPTVLAMVNDFDIMVKNAIQYNPPNTETGALILRRAHGLIDIVHAWVDNLNPTLVETCNKIIAERVARAQNELDAKEAAAKSTIEASEAAQQEANKVDESAATAKQSESAIQTGQVKDEDMQNTSPKEVTLQREVVMNGCTEDVGVVGSKNVDSEQKHDEESEGEADEEPVIAAKRSEVNTLMTLLLDVSTGLSVDGLEGLYVRCANVLHEHRRSMDRANVVRVLTRTVTQARDDPTVVGKLVA